MCFGRESLTGNDGIGCVYLDGWAMGSNYKINSRFYRGSPQAKNKQQNNGNFLNQGSGCNNASNDFSALNPIGQRVKFSKLA